MTATRTPLRNKAPSCRAGHGEKFPLSLARNTWMEGKASYFHGTKNTDQFTRKHCCITLILIKMMRNLFPKRKELKCRLLHWFPNRYSVFLYLITREILGHVKPLLPLVRTLLCRGDSISSFGLNERGQLLAHSFTQYWLTYHFFRYFLLRKSKLKKELRQM